MVALNHIIMQLKLQVKIWNVRTKLTIQVHYMFYRTYEVTITVHCYFTYEVTIRVHSVRYGTWEVHNPTRLSVLSYVRSYNLSTMYVCVIIRTKLQSEYIMCVLLYVRI